MLAGSAPLYDRMYAKPLVGDNARVCTFICRKMVKPVCGDQYAGLSETALYYIGGIVARAIKAF